MVRDFDGTDDELRVALGNCDLTGALTMAAVFKLDAAAATYQNLIANHTATSGLMSLELNVSEQPVLVGAAGETLLATTINTTDWYLLAATKASGTVAARIHLRNLTTLAAWAHTNGSGTVADAATQAGGTVRFGEWEDGDDLSGRLAVAGEWNVVLTDAQVEELEGGTVNWWRNTGGPPVGLWEFSQLATTTPVTDLTGGGANETVLAGTTVVTGADPPGFVFGMPAPAANYTKVL